MAEQSEKKIQNSIIKMIREQFKYRRFVRMVIPVALVLVVAVYWGLHVNAITLNSTELICGTAEHTHTESCYSWVSASGSIYTATATSSQGSVEAVESAEGTEDAEETENLEATEEVENLEATESVDTTEGTESTETVESTESTEADAAQYVLPTDAQAGDTIIVDGVEYAYTLTCTEEEHTHTDTCYSTADESESEADDNRVILTSYATDTDDEEESDVASEDDEGTTGSSAETSDDSADASEEEEVSSKTGIRLTSGADDSLEDESEEAITEDTTQSTVATKTTVGLSSDDSTDSSGTLTVADTKTGESITYTVADCTYDSDTGDFSVDVALKFTFNKDSSISNYYRGSDYDTNIVTDTTYTVAYEIKLPDGMFVPSDLIGYCYYGYDASGDRQFEYYFVENSDESGAGDGTYSAILVFSKTFIDGLTNATFSGDLSFDGYASQSSYDTSSGDIVLKYDMQENLSLTISKGDITWGGSETLTEDISVKKTGKYNSSDGTITYTIIVYSELGTGDTITLTDYFADDNLADILGDMGIITYQSATTEIETWTNASGTTSYESNNGTTTSGTASDVVAYTEGETTEYPYYYYDEDGKLVIVLGKLNAVDESNIDTEASSDGSTTVTKQLNSWVITYTYEVNPESNVVYYSTNKVSTTTYDKVADTDITKQTSATVSVSGTTMIAKSGSYDNNGTITWTIVVGDGQSDLNGYILTDNMLAEMSSGSLTITDKNGNAVASSGILYATRKETTVMVGEEEVDTYTYTYYSDATLEMEVTGITVDSTSGLPTDTSTYSIVILYESDDSNGAELAGIIFNGGTQYTIQYKTELDSAWSSQYITNGAEITYEGTNTDNTGSGYESTGSVWITGQGQNAFSKKNTGATVDADNSKLYTLEWTTTYSVPSTGIPEGTKFTDYVSSSSGSDVHSITSAQAVDIIAAVKGAWGEDNITTIQFCTSSSYWSNYYSDDNWVDADVIDSTGNTVYYQFRFTTVYEVEYYNEKTMADSLTDTEFASLKQNGYFTRPVTENGTTATKLYYADNAISYTYNTTSNVDGYDTNSYYNYLTDSYTTKTATWTWYEKVVKYGTTTSGYTSGSGTTKLTVTDDKATVSWIVRVVLDGSSNTYTITDTLPAGVTLSNLYVSTSGSSYGYEQITIGENYGTSETTSITGMGTFNCVLSQDEKDTADNVTDDVYTVKLDVSGLDSGVSMLYIKYVCSAENLSSVSDSTISNDGKTTTYAIGDLTNHVTVMTDDETVYGKSDETTTLTWKKEEKDTQELMKEAEFDENNNILEYSVLINKDGTTYAYENSEGEKEDYDSLTVTDVLSYYSYPMYGNVRSATLITSSVKLYYVTVDDDGTVTKKSAVSTSDYTWTLSEDIDANDWQEYITKTMTLTVPNGTAMLLEYQYLITVVIDGTGWTDSGANVTNSAVLSAEAEEIYSTTPTYNNNKIKDSSTSASVSGNAGYTIYKVDEDNFSTTLSGAVFTLYVYSGSNFSKLGTFTTSSSGTLTVSGTLVEDSNGDPDYYSVTMSDGTTASIPVDTMCYLRETAAPEYYKVDGVNYYFYFGSSIGTSASDCNGYDSDTMGNAKNVIVSYTNYITNEHSSDYYANKTTLSVTKTWIDADGESYMKTDGSLVFDLYRVLILKDGTITSVAEQEATVDEAQEGETETESGGSTAKEGEVTLSWTLEDSAGVTSTGSYSVEASADNPREITLSVYWPGLIEYPDWWWYAIASLYRGSNDSGYKLATFNEMVDLEDSDDSKIIYDSDLVTKIWIDDTDYTYNITIELTENLNLYFYIDDFITNYADMSDLKAKVIDVSGDTESGSSGDDTGSETDSSGGDTGSGTGSSGDDTGSGTDSSETTSETTSSTGTIYSATFSTLFPSNTADYFYDSEKGTYTKDYLLNKVAMGTVEGSSENTGFFTVMGNLNTTHDSVAWDVDGDGVVETGEILDVCLKMESKVGDTGTATWIQFTSKEGGYLRLAFNAEDGITSSVTITDSEGNSTDYYAEANTIYVYLDAGTYTISRNTYCFLYYIEFAEGATEANDVTDTYYIQNFNNGTSSASGFYTLSGELSHSYGSISYKGVSASQCLKMGSKASISFTTEESGTLYLIMTNPKGSKKVGVVVDGSEVLATATNYKNSAGYTIYELTTRLTAGSHTITRISSTENMLYYIAYTPDDYGGKEWDSDAEDQALGALLNKDKDTYEAYMEYAQLVGSYTLDATNDWSWASSQLPSEYLNTDTGDVLGYFVYFVEEVPIYDVNGGKDEDGNYRLAFTTTYLNDSGITGGSIGIANQINPEVSGSTNIAVQKKWDTETAVSSISSTYSTDVLNTLLEAIETAEISYEVYAKMDITSTDGESTTGESEECWFTTTSGSDFFTLGSGASTTPNGGEITYGKVTTDTALKMNSGGIVYFDAPAEDGTLTLVFSALNKTKSSSSTVVSYYGPDFAVTGPDGKTYTYVYDGTTGTFTDKNGKAITNDLYSVKCTDYDTDNNVAVFTLTLGSSGEYTIARGASTECYLYYINYAYLYSKLVDGVLTKSGTLTASSYYETTDENGNVTDTTYWAKLYQGLPYRVFDDSGTKIIGTYSYTVKETGVKMTIDGVEYELKPDDEGNYTISFTDKNNSSIVYKYKISSTAITAVSGTTTSTSTGVTVASDTATITNAVTATRTYTGAILPATGGISREQFYAIVAMLMGLCATLLLTHLHQESMQKRKGRQG